MTYPLPDAVRIILRHSRSRIALQHGKGATDESGIVKFRKVEIRPL